MYSIAAHAFTDVLKGQYLNKHNHSKVSDVYLMITYEVRGTVHQLSLGGECCCCCCCLQKTVGTAFR